MSKNFSDALLHPPAFPAHGHAPVRAYRVAAVAVLLAAAAGCGAEPESAPALMREVEAGEVHLQNLQQLTFGGQNAEAYFSADGERLIFQRTGVDQGCDQQYVMNVDGSNMDRVSNGLGRTTCGFFYSDDQRVVYSSTSHLSDSCPPVPDLSQGYVWPLHDFEIYTSRPDGSDLQRLTNSPGYDAEATLSPDGKRLIFTSTRDGDLDLYTMDIHGGDVVRVTNRVGYDGGAFFSPDGSRIVWRAFYPESADEVRDYLDLLQQGLVRPSRMEIWVANADGSEAKQVTQLGGANFAPYFHPDGDRIIFSSNHAKPRERNFDLYMVNLDGTGVKQITMHGEFDGFPMFSRDGRKLVFASNRFGSVEGETNVFTADWVESPLPPR